MDSQPCNNFVNIQQLGKGLLLPQPILVGGLSGRIILIDRQIDR